MIRMLCAMLSALMLSTVLTSCGSNENPPPLEILTQKPNLEEAPYWMRRPCPRPKSLDRTKRGQAVLESEWRKDLKQYDDCRVRHAAHVQWIAERDAAITGKPLQAPKNKKVKKPVASKSQWFMN